MARPAWPRLVCPAVQRWIAGFASLRFAFGQTPVLKEGTGGLRGVVLEASGRPIANARIWIGQERMAQTGALGRFEFTDVRPGRHLVSVDVTMSQRVFVEVFAGRVVEVPSTDLLLKVQALAGEISPPPRISGAALGGVTGTIMDQSGATVARARVQVATEAGEPIRAVSSSDLGLFLIKDLAPGEYQLRVESLNAKQPRADRAPGWLCRRSGGNSLFSVAPIVVPRDALVLYCKFMFVLPAPRHHHRHHHHACVRRAGF